MFIIFLSVKIKVKGIENIPKNSDFLLHHFINLYLKLFFLQTIFNSPIFILKKELLKIPIFGWHLKKLDAISINRDKINKDNLGFYDKIANL